MANIDLHTARLTSVLALVGAVEEKPTRPLPSPDECRRIREDAGLSIEEAAAICGVASQTYWRWEHGVNRPRARNGRNFCKVLTALASEGR
jgi:DNA-binding transcriptional regulator YiaG